MPIEQKRIKNGASLDGEDLMYSRKFCEACIITSKDNNNFIFLVTCKKHSELRQRVKISPKSSTII